MLKDDRAHFLSMFEDTSRVEDRNAHPSHRIEAPLQNKVLSPKSLYSSNRHCLKSIVSLELFQVKEALKIYEWRTKTRSPIILSRWTAISLNKTSNIIRNKHDLLERMRESEGNSDVRVQLKVETEKVEPLESFQPLSFANFIYAFKEAIVGFQRLYSLFGPLKILSKMVVVNNAGKVKVWLTTHYDQNFKQDHPAFENCPNYEPQLVRNLLDIFYGFRQESPTYRDFFKAVQESETFISLIRFVEDFVASKRILVSKCITLKKITRVCRHISPEIKVTEVVRGAPFASPRPSVYVKSQSPNNKLLYRTNSHAGFLHHTFSSRPFKLEETKETLPSSHKNESDEEWADREGLELRDGGLLNVPAARNVNLAHNKASSSMNSGQDTPSSIDEPMKFTLKNSIQQKMQKLLSNSDDEIYSFDGNHPEEYEDPSRLSNYGRNVKGSIILPH